MAVLEGRFTEGDHIVADATPSGELTFTRVEDHAGEPAHAAS
jgi:hypothetical protein